MNGPCGTIAVVIVALLTGLQHEVENQGSGDGSTQTSQALTSRSRALGCSAVFGRES
jgi:hypothetical protein